MRYLRRLQCALKWHDFKRLGSWSRCQRDFGTRLCFKWEDGRW